MRLRAFESASDQTLPPAEIHVMIDRYGDGEIHMRNALLDSVCTEWVAWLDDDDEMLPQHLESLASLIAPGVDLIYSDYETRGAKYVANFIEPAYLCRTQSMLSAGGFPEPESRDWPYRYGDWGMLAKMLNRGYHFRKFHGVTWRKYIHDSNICGTGF